MDKQNRQSDLKIVIGILLVAILALTAIFFFNNREVKNKLDDLAVERELIVNELKGMKQSFAIITQENEQYSQEIQRSQERIDKLLDSVEQLQVAANKMFLYRKQVVALQKQNKALRNLVDSLKKNNVLFKEEITAAKTTIADLNDDVTDLTDQVEADAKAEKAKAERLAKEASMLALTEFSGNAYKLRSNGNLIDTNRANKTQRLRACFTINANAMVSNGEKEFYIQFIDPQGNVIQDNGSTISHNGLEFSKKTSILYRRQDLQVCDFISVEENQLAEGNYRIQIYFGSKVIATTSFELK